MMCMQMDLLKMEEDFIRFVKDKVKRRYCPKTWWGYAGAQKKIKGRGKTN